MTDQVNSANEYKLVYSKLSKSNREINLKSNNKKKQSSVEKIYIYQALELEGKEEKRIGEGGKMGKKKMKRKKRGKENGKIREKKEEGKRGKKKGGKSGKENGKIREIKGESKKGKGEKVREKGERKLEN